MIYVRVRHLPPESACASIAGGADPWTREQILLAHVWQAAAHSPKPHPWLAEAMNDARVDRRRADPQRARRLVAARKRANDRRARIAAGELTRSGEG
jgi:hypothetical protein